MPPMGFTDFHRRQHWFYGDNLTYFGESARILNQCCRLRRSERLAVQFNSSMPTNNTSAANNRSRFVIFILQVTG